jgi:hypothetical protein
MEIARYRIGVEGLKKVGGRGVRSLKINDIQTWNVERSLIVPRKKPREG